MKIAYVSDAIYPYNKGGKEKRLFDISTRLAKMGHDVHIYCMKWWEGKETYRLENGVHLHAISPYYPLYSGERRSIKQGILFGIACLKMLKENWDVVDVDHMPFFPIIFMKIVCVLKGKKLIATWNEVWGLNYWKEYLGWKGYIAGLIEYISLKLPNTIISISEHTTARLKLFRMEKDIITIPIGIDFNIIQKIIPSKEKYEIMFAGRLLKHKNIDILLKSLEIINKNNISIKAIIIGNGPERESLEKLSKKLKLNNTVTFQNFFPKENDLYAIMKSSRIFVLPSSREGFGLVALEAYACGLHVITVDEEDNAAKELKNIVILAELNASSLAQTIKHVLHKKTSSLITNKHSWTNIISQLVKVYSL